MNTRILMRHLPATVFTLMAALATMLFGTDAFAQVSGDYRSNVASGNWNATSSWQTFNGTSWVAASSTPPARTA